MNRSFALLAAFATAGFALNAPAQLVNAIKAVVHDAAVTQWEVESYTEPVEEMLRNRYRNQPEVYERELTKALNENLEERLRRQLVLHDFKVGGYNIPEPILQDAVDSDMRKKYGDREKLIKSLQARGMTYEKFRQQTRENIILGALRSKNIAQEIIVSPHRIEAFYQANKDKYKVADEVKLRRIMLKATSEDEAASSRKLANEIRTKIKAGAAFSEMAAIYSQSTDKKDGGLWGWVEQSALAKELADGIAGLKPGEVSEPLQVGNACFLLLLEEKRAAHNKALSEVREEIESNLMKEERDRLEKQWIDRLKKKTYVRYF